MIVSLVQPTLEWEDPESNLALLERIINADDEPSELIVLPEMFTTGFTMRPEKHAAPHGSVWLDWMSKMARKKNAVVAGSLAIRDAGSYFNRFYWVQPDGTISYYDKRHLFRMGNEHEHYRSGAKRVVASYKGWNFLPQVCYDLRFPVWSRNKFVGSAAEEVSYEYDVLIYVANWPAVRSHAWKHLLIARAIENQCYVIGVNRTGKDGNGVDHSGDSVVIGPMGETLLSLSDETNVVKSCKLDKTSLDTFRKRFPAGADADDFTLRL